jgi:DNA-binding MarR family transcriptional regulator
VNEKERLMFMLMERFSRVVAKTVEIEKTPKSYGTKELFYKAEIHMLEMIEHTKKATVTGLAKALNITKGAVSQTIAKLESKDLIIKEPDCKNNSRVIITLSRKGYEVHKEHIAWHDKVDKGFRNMFFNLDTGKLTFLNDFLSKFEDFLDVEI